MGSSPIYRSVRSIFRKVINSAKLLVKTVVSSVKYIDHHLANIWFPRESPSGGGTMMEKMEEMIRQDPNTPEGAAAMDDAMSAFTRDFLAQVFPDQPPPSVT